MSRATKEGVYYDMPDSEYHEQHDEGHFFSSSQLKKALENIREFKRIYMDGESDPVSQATQDAFDVGTVVHTALLEPEKLKDSYVKWTTGNRTGKVWEEFVKENEGKLILNPTMLKQANNAIKMAKASKLYMSYLNPKKGKPEVSFFVKYMGMNIKVRADWFGKKYIADVKTTSGDVSNEDKIKSKVKSLAYDLSAALYVDVVNYCIDKFDLPYPKVETFIWLFTSKDKKMPGEVYDAYDYLEMGRAKYKKAIEDIQKAEANGWVFKQEVRKIAPNAYDKAEWVKQETVKKEEVDTDLL